MRIIDMVCDGFMKNEKVVVVKNTTDTETIIEKYYLPITNIIAWENNKTKLLGKNEAGEVVDILSLGIENIFSNSFAKDEIKAGDYVIHKDSPDVVRCVFEVDEGKALLWGFYEYVDISRLEKIEKE